MTLISNLEKIRMFTVDVLLYLKARWCILVVITIKDKWVNSNMYFTVISKFYQGQPHRKLPDDKNWRFPIWLCCRIMQYFFGIKSKGSSLFPLWWSDCLPHVSISNHVLNPNHGINHSFLNNCFQLWWWKLYQNRWVKIFSSFNLWSW